MRSKRSCRARPQSNLNTRTAHGTKKLLSNSTMEAAQEAYIIGNRTYVKVADKWYYKDNDPITEAKKEKHGGPVHAGVHPAGRGNADEVGLVTGKRLLRDLPPATGSDLLPGRWARAREDGPGPRPDRERTADRGTEGQLEVDEHAGRRNHRQSARPLLPACPYPCEAAICASRRKVKPCG